MPIVLDFSAARPGAAAITACGATGVVRYVGAITTSFNLTQPEVDELLAAGLDIGVVIERQTGDILLGRAKGAEMAALALKETRALGLPDGVVYAAVDIDGTLGGPTTPGSPGDKQMTLIRTTLEGFADALGWENVGVYGSYFVIDWLISKQVPVKVFWQTEAWSRDPLGRILIHPAAALIQRTTSPVPIPGGCDYNDAPGDWRPRLPKAAPGMNTTQIQQALVDIGFPIAVDGGYGDQTKRAVSYFQEGWPGLAVDSVAGPATQAALAKCQAQGGKITDHFAYREFACTHCHWPRVRYALVAGLEVYRAKLSPGGVRVVSGYRCPIRNSQIPGAAPNSQHLEGTACDIDPVARTNSVIALRVFSGIEYRATGRVYHVDVRASKPDSNWTHSTVQNPSVFRFGIMPMARAALGKAPRKQVEGCLS